MGLSDGFKRLFGKATAGGEHATESTYSKRFEHQRIRREGVEMTDPAELDVLVKKIETLSEAASASSAHKHVGSVTVSKAETTRIIDGPEDLGDPAVHAALASVVGLWRVSSRSCATKASARRRAGWPRCSRRQRPDSSRRRPRSCRRHDRLTPLPSQVRLLRRLPRRHRLPATREEKLCSACPVATIKRAVGKRSWAVDRW